MTGVRGTVRVKVDNLCPECGPGHLDLSNEAFARLDDLGKGITPITYRQVVDPKLGNALSFRVKEGSSQWWLAILVDNHGNPLRSVEVSTGGTTWRTLTRAAYNYWIADTGAGPGPFRVRVTDTRGHVAVASGIAVRPGQVQRTAVRLYGAGSTGGGTPATSRRATGTKATRSTTPRATARTAVATGSSTTPASPPPSSPALPSSSPPPSSPPPSPTTAVALAADAGPAEDTVSPPISTVRHGWWC